MLNSPTPQVLSEAQMDAAIDIAKPWAEGSHKGFGQLGNICQALLQSRAEVNRLREHLGMYKETNNLRPLWFISEAKKLCERNPAIVSETDNLLVQAVLQVILDNVDKEMVGTPDIPTTPVQGKDNGD